MKDFFEFVSDMWWDMTGKQRVTVSVIAGIFIFLVVTIIF
jgi:hypothetical protein|tara:strand:+ start:534 stop:653 length:120 start_codon:yes stop_codon:yes gene_type:complete